MSWNDARYGRNTCHGTRSLNHVVIINIIMNTTLQRILLLVMWHGHVEQKGDADCVKACTKFVVEGMAGRRTSGRTLCLPTTRLLEVAPRDGHDRLKWRDIGWRTVDKAVSEKLLFKSRKKNINYNQIQECVLYCQLPKKF